MSSGSRVQDTVSVRIRHTQYFPDRLWREKKEEMELNVIGGETFLRVTVYVPFVYDYYE